MSNGQIPIDVSGQVPVVFDLGSFSISLTGEGRRLSSEGVAVSFSRGIIAEDELSFWQRLLKEGRLCRVRLQLEQCSESRFLQTKLAALREHKNGWDVVFAFDQELPSLYREESFDNEEINHSLSPEKESADEKSISYDDWSRCFDDPGAPSRAGSAQFIPIRYPLGF